VVPRIDLGKTSHRVLTMEFIDGTKVSVHAMVLPRILVGAYGQFIWRMLCDMSLCGLYDAFFSFSQASAMFFCVCSNHRGDDKPFPLARFGWLSPSPPQVTDKAGLAALGTPPSALAKLISRTFNAMIFRWGWVHADPHAANMLVRKAPPGSNATWQLVLLDHGLYRELDNTFRLE
jgi:hypothetical protein